MFYTALSLFVCEDVNSFFLDFFTKRQDLNYRFSYICERIVNIWPVDCNVLSVYRKTLKPTVEIIDNSFF